MHNSLCSPICREHSFIFLGISRCLLVPPAASLSSKLNVCSPLTLKPPNYHVKKPLREHFVEHNRHFIKPCPTLSSWFHRARYNKPRPEGESLEPRFSTLSVSRWIFAPVMSRAGSGKEATEGRHGIIHARGRSSVALINIIWVVMPAGGVGRND